MTTTNLQDSVLLEMSFNCYGNPDDNIDTPDGYIISNIGEGNNGFKARVYKNIQNPNEIIIAYAGTDSPGDWISNLQMAVGAIPDQYTQALNTYNVIKSENPNANITITGHSLGGSLAQLVGAATGSNTVTFNSYGTSEIFENMGFNPNANYSNITNYNNSTDILHTANLAKGVHNLGNSYIIQSNNNDQLNSHVDFETISNSLNNVDGYMQPITLEVWLAQNKEYNNAAHILGTGCGNNLDNIIRNSYAVELIVGYSEFAITKPEEFIILLTEEGHKVIELDNIANAEEILTRKGEFNKELNEADRLDALPSDPLIFDLNGDGKISLTDLDNGTNFDIDNDGFAQKISWVSGQDGILVLDRNNNGTIDNGLELFGENTILSDGTPAQGGIQALSELDTNNDGIIDANDSQFSDLKFLKADGTKVSLQDAGISQIILQYNEVSNADEHGNVMVKSASFVKTDGSVHQYGEFMLNQNHYETIHTDKLELPESYDDLPEVQGTGLVMSLKQAMVRDTSGELLNTLESFLQEDDLAQKREIVETLIYKWAGTENVSLDGRGLADGRKLATIEKFVGRYFLNEEGSIVDKEHVKHVLEESWNRLFDYVYAQLAVQTHGRELLAHIGIKYVNNSWVVDGGDSLAYFEEIIADDTSENKMHSKNLIRDFGTILHQYNYADNFENLTEYITQMQNLLGEEYVEMFVAGVSDEAWTDYWDITYADGVIYGGGGDDNIKAANDVGNLFHGGDGNDVLQGRTGNDTFYGGAGNDSIDAQKGNDTVYGGSGDDTIYSGEGDDTIVFNTGDGNDIIYDYSGYDIIKINGSSEEDICFYKDDDSLVLNYSDTNFITIDGYYNSDAYKIEKVELDNGSYITSATIEQIIQDMNAYATENGIQISSANDIANNDELMQLVTSGWQ